MVLESQCVLTVGMDVEDHFPKLSLKDVDESLVNDGKMEEEDLLRFKEARDGDHLMVTFICDTCIFWDLRQRLPRQGDLRDEWMMICIRRINLDSFWACERSTVLSNRREALKYIKIHNELGEVNPYKPRGPWDVSFYSLGYKATIGMVMRALDEGKYAEFIQFETTRRLRSHVSNFEHTTPGGIGNAFVNEEGRVPFLSNASTDSPWFRHFVTGCHRRMGDIWVPDRPVKCGGIKSCV